MTPFTFPPVGKFHHQPAGSESPVIVLDIGSTFVTGPVKGPANRIADRVGLDRRRKSALHSALMTIDFRGPRAIANFRRTELQTCAAAAQQAAFEVWEMQEDEASPITGSVEALTALAGAGFRFAVVSNIWQPFLTATRKHFGDFFDELVPVERQLFSFREGTAKPAPDLFRRMLLATGAPAHRTVMVGDSYNDDIAPAATLGARTIWLLSRPADDAAHLDAVMTGVATRPSLALWSIADLDPTRVSTLFNTDRNRACGTGEQTEELQ
jgi:HAD superfamily hydrolase (TIGR01509 family)